jgi:hypothetical protein
MSPRTDYPLTFSDTARAEASHETDRGVLTRYSVVLLTLHNGEWQTVRVYDNTHTRHDMHRHTLSGGKQPAEVFHHGTPSEAYNAALELVGEGFEEMIAGWHR